MRFAFIAVLSHGRIGLSAWQNPAAAARFVGFGLLSCHLAQRVIAEKRHTAQPRGEPVVFEGGREPAILLQCGSGMSKPGAVRRRVRWRHERTPWGMDWYSVLRVERRAPWHFCHVAY